MGAQGKPWSEASDTTQSAVCVSVIQPEAPAAGTPGHWDFSLQCPAIWYLYPSIGGIQTVNPRHLTQTADFFFFFLKG